MALYACAVAESRMMKNDSRSIPTPKIFKMLKALRDIPSPSYQHAADLSWWKLRMAVNGGGQSRPTAAGGDSASGGGGQGDRLQLVETLTAVEEVKGDQLQLAETLGAVEELGQSRPSEQ